MPGNAERFNFDDASDARAPIPTVSGMLARRYRVTTLGAKSEADSYINPEVPAKRRQGRTGPVDTLPL